MNAAELSSELITQGVKEHWQDLYLLPQKDCYHIYYRIGTNRNLLQTISLELAQQVISRFKYLGEMDVGEKRKAQLGAITYNHADGEQRLRLSTVGDYQQRESLVVRFLFHFGNQKEKYVLEEQITTIQSHLNQRGLYLFSGPVGSGKTTLMYKLAKTFSGQIITIEDPVEIEEPDFLQLQTNNKINQDYDTLIRLSLRHHPDVLIIGEIRDQVTAEAAIRAALTGHYVFATIHARSLSSIQARLLELTKNTGDLRECLQGIIYMEMLQIDEPQVLCAYQFFQSSQLVEEYTWEEGLEEVQKKIAKNQKSHG